jgi:hypothetical protein
MTATVPRILATILNETIVAGMVVLLHRWRAADSSLAAHLHISRSKSISWYWSMTGSQRGVAIAEMRGYGPPQLAAAASSAAIIGRDSHVREVFAAIRRPAARTCKSGRIQTSGDIPALAKSRCRKSDTHGDPASLNNQDYHELSGGRHGHTDL